MKKKKSIIGSIGWFKTIFLLGFGVFMLIGGNEGYKAHQVYEHMEPVPLSEINGEYKDGDLVKITAFRADVKHRVRGLYDKTKSKDLSLLIPLRPPGEEQGDEINYLYLMPDDSYDSIRMLFETYQDSRLDMESVEELVVEVSEIDELKGDVPDAVRKNKMVGKNVMILWHREDDPAWGVFVIFGSVFLLIWGVLYLKYYLKSRKEEELY